MTHYFLPLRPERCERCREIVDWRQAHPKIAVPHSREVIVLTESSARLHEHDRPLSLCFSALALRR